MGANVQVCWEKFCRYWDVEARLVPMEGDALPPHGGPGGRGTATRTPSASSPCSAPRSTAPTSRWPTSAPALDRHQADTGLDVPVHVDGAVGRVRRPVHRPRPRVGLPPAAGPVDQRLGPQVRAGLPGRGLGDLAQPRGAARRPRVRRQLPRRRHADVRPQLLAARQPGGGAVLQLRAPRHRRLPARPADVARRGDVHVRGHRASSGPSGCSPTAASCPVFAFAARRHRPALHGVRRVGARCATAAGWCRPTRSPRTARTSPRCASSCATACPATSPTCSSPTSSRHVDVLRVAARPAAAARAPARVPPLSRHHPLVTGGTAASIHPVQVMLAPPVRPTLDVAGRTHPRMEMSAR